MPTASTGKHREPRHGRPRPPKPPLELVAREALSLAPESEIAKYLRATPEVADRVRRLEALHRFDQLAPELGAAEAERRASVACGVSPRSIRRWRRGL